MIKTPDDEKKEIIRLRLLGNTYSQILYKYQIGGSKGNISNIMEEWKQQIGQGNAEVILDFIRQLNKSKTSLLACVEGARTSNALKEIGIEEDNIELVARAIHKRAVVKEGLSPTQLGNIIVSFAKLSEGEPTIPLDQLPDYVKQKKEEAKRSEDNLASLQAREQDALGRIDQALASAEAKITEVEEYSAVKKSLKERGLDIRETGKLDTAISNCKELGYDSRKIAESISNVELLSGRVNELHAREASLLTSCAGLEERKSNLETEEKEAESRLLRLRQDQEKVIFSISSLSRTLQESIRKSTEECREAISVAKNVGNEFVRTLSETALDLRVEIEKNIARLEELSGRYTKLAPLIEATENGDKRVNNKELLLALLEALNIALEATPIGSPIRHHTLSYKEALMRFLSTNQV